MGIESTIVPLKWPQNTDPHDNDRFETEARRLRYQALGLTCRHQKINSLLVAHHGDDQAETVMMRLMKGRWRTGLRGMLDVEWIPECHGIYGVHHSGDLTIERSRRKASSNIPLVIEKGGIQILRPLLGFEKTRLVASCKENGTAWAEDKTNHIPTFTVRNTVRHIMQNHKLPEALSNRSLISLSQRINERIKIHKEAADKIFNETLIQLDLQTGSLLVRFPPASKFLDEPIITHSDKKKARNTVYLFLQRIAELISPKEVPSIGQFSGAIDNIWPTLCMDPHLQTNRTFCVFKVWFRPWNNPTPFPSSNTFPRIHEMEYLLSRQPLEHNEKTVADLFLTIPPSIDPETPEKWNLFDNRFWICVKNHTTDDIIIRMLRQDDIIQLSSGTKSPIQPLNKRERFLKAALNLIKPSDIRTTIPAIFQKHKPGPDTKDGAKPTERLLALPTLGVNLNTHTINFKEQICSYKIRYKKIDLGERSVKEVVKRGIQMHDVMHEISRSRKVGEKKRRLKEEDRIRGVGRLRM